MSVSHPARRPAWPDAVGRAFELAESGGCRDMAELVARLRDEGYPTVLTDLRSKLLRRELREVMERARAPSDGLEADTGQGGMKT